MNFLSHLECGYCGEKYDADKIFNLCHKCSKPLLVRYDLKSASKVVKKENISSRLPNLWRYRELLPIRNDKYILSLGEGFTPLFNAKNLAASVDFENLLIKDEGLNPTGSFKARGLCLAVSKAYY